METVFLSFSFDDDRELANQIQLLIESHGLRAISGDTLGGGALTPEVQKLIEEADGLVAIATRANKIAPEKYQTHPWVRDELGYARAKLKPSIALRETGVDMTGMGSENEHIAYDPAKATPAIVKLSRTLRRWIADDGRLLKVKLDADDSISEIATNENITLEYRWVAKGKAGKWREGTLYNEPGATFAYINAQDDVLIQIRIRVEGSSRWSSPAVQQWMSVQLKKEAGR